VFQEERSIFWEVIVSAFWLRMIDTMTSQNIDLAVWDILYINHVHLRDIQKSHAESLAVGHLV
jgi:hypothetical protein